MDDVLHPARESRSDLDNIRSELGEDIFAAQYQQCPSQPTGHIIKRESIQRYDHLPIRTKSHYLLQSWDTAIKPDARNDYSVGVTLLVDDRGNYYVVEGRKGSGFLSPTASTGHCSGAKTQTGHDSD